MAVGVEIKGGKYPATISKDGWAIFRNVPIMGFVPKGEKSAPEDITAKWMEPAVKFSQTEYKSGNFAAPVHKGHHKSLAIEDPEFLGFFLPKTVGKITLDGKEQDAVFADIKLKPSAFELAKKGELPYLSPEVDWATGKFMSLSFLDSNPPHFHFPNFTVGDIANDDTASFEAVLKPAKFDDEEREKKGKDPATACCAHCSAYQSKFGYKFSDGGPMDTPKPSGTPIEPGKPPTMEAKPAVKLEDDPKIAAQFAALKDENAAIKARLDAKDAEAAAVKFEAAALKELEGYQIGDSAKAQIAKFARRSEAELKDLVATLKEVSKKNPPTSMAEFVASGISASDPVLAKFQKSPDELAAATRAYAAYKLLKERVPAYSVPPEKHIEMELKAPSLEGGF